MGLPDREAVVGRLAAMIDAPQRVPSDARAVEACPTVCVIAVDGHDDLVLLDRGGTTAAMEEIARRLDRLVRSADVLGRLGDDRFVLVAPSMQPAVTGTLVERIEGAVALPIELGGQPVSLGVTVGLAFADRRGDSDSGSADAVLLSAEADVEHRRSRRRG